MRKNKSSFNKRLFVITGSMIILVIVLILLSVVLFELKNSEDKSSNLSQDTDFSIAKSYYYDGYYEIAEERFKKAIKEHPEKDEYYYWLAETFYQLKKDKEVVQMYDKYLSFKPNDIAVLIHVSNICDNLKEYDLAVKYLERAIKIAPNNEVVNNNLCWAFSQKKQYTKALPFCQKAISISPGEDYILDSMGYVLSGLSRTDESIRYYKDAISINPNKPDYHLHIAEAYSVKKYKALAVQHYEKYLKLAPKTPRREEIQQIIEKLKSNVE